MANYGIKITKAGKGITSTDPVDYIFNSTYGTVKIVKEPTDKEYETIVVANASSAIASVEHGLSFPPLVLLFTELKPGSGHWYCGGLVYPDPTDFSGSVLLDGEADSGTYVDDTYFKIRYTNNTGSEKTVKYYYFIFGDSGE